eukprot:6207454-Pleurochrysis_carterae.AAC.1
MEMGMHSSENRGGVAPSRACTNDKRAGKYACLFRIVVGCDMNTAHISLHFRGSPSTRRDVRRY